MNESHDLIVIGAGLAGLTAAALAGTAGSRVLVLDSHNGDGRAAVTVRSGFLFNGGAHALYQGGAAVRVLNQLGIHPTGAPPATTGYGQRGGQIGLLPTGPVSLLRTKLLGTRSKAQVARWLTKLQRVDAAALGGLSMQEWLSRAELRPDTDDLARMLIRVATYCDSPEALSADAGVRQVQVAMGPGVRYLDDGWAQLTHALRAVIARNGGSFQTGSAVRQVGTDGSGASVSMTDGTDLHASAVILAVGGPGQAAGLLASRPASWVGLGPDSVVSCLELGLRQPSERLLLFDLQQPLYYSVHCPPARLAPMGQAVAHAMRYLKPGEQRPADESRADLEYFAAAAGATDDIIVERRYLHRMTAAYALPTPANGGLAGRPGVTIGGQPNVYVTGDWVGPEGLLADAVMASAAAAVGAAAEVHRRDATS
jgi:phytoene dehydrogenase-like protein